MESIREIEPSEDNALEAIAGSEPFTEWQSFRVQDNRECGNGIYEFQAIIPLIPEDVAEFQRMINKKIEARGGEIIKIYNKTGE
ncbi:hypothetical protein KY308_00455, partial [Candidatus Woesearchaeota archaeon]|nr:hypothetical protein [Candidatus Woesearchaeota archaeon]